MGMPSSILDTCQVTPLIFCMTWPTDLHLSEKKGIQTYQNMVQCIKDSPIQTLPFLSTRGPPCPVFQDESRPASIDPPTAVCRIARPCKSALERWGTGTRAERTMRTSVWKDQNLPKFPSLRTCPSDVLLSRSLQFIHPHHTEQGT